jgi:hypothetical protein
MSQVKNQYCILKCSNVPRPARPRSVHSTGQLLVHSFFQLHASPLYRSIQFLSGVLRFPVPTDTFYHLFQINCNIVTQLPIARNILKADANYLTNHSHKMNETINVTVGN